MTDGQAGLPNFSEAPQSRTARLATGQSAQHTNPFGHA